MKTKNSGKKETDAKNSRKLPGKKKKKTDERTKNKRE